MLRNLLRAVLSTGARPSQPSPSLDDIIARGRAALEAGRIEDAEQLAEAVFASSTKDARVEAEAFHIRAQARSRRHDFNGALDDYESALQRKPNSLAVRINQCRALNELGRFEEGLSAVDAALRIDPRQALAHNCRGLMLSELGRLEDAEAALRSALQYADADLDVRANLAFVLIEQSRFNEAESELASVLAADPVHSDARWYRAHARLLRGDFARGWSDYESRLKRHEALLRPYRYPRWDGRALNEVKLLIHAEQGLGDEILFASCIDDAIARAGHCVIECEPRLERLFARTFPRARVVGSKNESSPDWVAGEPRVAAQIPAGSLPGLFRNRREDFPAHHGYLEADPAKVRAWRARLDALGAGLKVGIAWTGGALKTRRALRSIALAQWLPILRTPHTQFVSLQYVDSTTEIADLALRYGLHIQHWPDATADYDETAALVGALDLVISVTTAVTDLAGALGQRVWVLVPASPEWRFLASGEAMPWYPAMRLFRQARPCDWTPVIERVADELQRFVSGSRGGD